METATFMLSIINLVAIISLAIVTLFLNFKIEKFKIVEKQLMEKKKDIYARYARVFLRMSYDPEFKRDFEKDPSVVVKELGELTTDLAFFAPDNILREYIEFRSYASARPTDGDPEMLRKYAHVIISMREDLGYEGSTFDIDGFLGLFITDWDKYKDL